MNFKTFQSNSTAASDDYAESAVICNLSYFGGFCANRQGIEMDMIDSTFYASIHWQTSGTQIQDFALTM